MHSTDAFDRDIIQGYGVMVLPTVPGRYVRYVRMFRPASSSLMQEFQAWITGNRPQVCVYVWEYYLGCQHLTQLGPLLSRLCPLAHPTVLLEQVCGPRRWP